MGIGKFYNRRVRVGAIIVYQHLAFWLKQLLALLRVYLLDLYEFCFGLRPPMTPPRRKIFIGDGDFSKTGKEFFEYFISIGGLKPDHKVLDLGSGMGRMAIPLTTFLSDSTEYHGVDIVKSGIVWSKKHISKKHPNFNFHLLDIYSHRYNRKGTFKAADYKLPFENETFDFICANSLFTHLLASDMQNYLSEVGRLLKPGGTSFLTFFLINEESKSQISEGNSNYSFTYKISKSYYDVKNNPEGQTAYDELFLREELKTNSLVLKDPIHYGSWCGRDEFTSYQDIIIATKE